MKYAPEIYNKLVEDSIERFQGTKDVYWVRTDSVDPSSLLYMPYRIGEAIIDAMIDSGSSTREIAHSFNLRNHLENEIKQKIDGWQEVTRRREDQADLFNRFAK